MAKTSKAAKEPEVVDDWEAELDALEEEEGKEQGAASQNPTAKVEIVKPLTPMSPIPTPSSQKKKKAKGKASAPAPAQGLTKPKPTLGTPNSTQTSSSYGLIKTSILKTTKNTHKQRGKRR